MGHVTESNEFDALYMQLKNRTVGKPTRRPDGSPITYVGVFMDIADRRDLLSKLAQQRESLNAAVKNLPAEQKSTEVRAMIETYGKKAYFINFEALDPLATIMQAAGSKVTVVRECCPCSLFVC